MLYIESLNGCVWRRMEYLVSYSLSKQNWKKIFLRLLRFFFYLLLSLLAFSIWQTVNRIRVCIVCIYIFYDRKMTFRCVCVWFEMMTIATTATATVTASMMEKLFQINGKCCPNDRCCCWFYCPYYFYRQHYHRALFLRIANRFMSFQFFFALSFFSIFSYHGFFCSTSYQTVNAPVYFFFFFFFLLKCAIFVFDVKNTRITCLC